MSIGRDPKSSPPGIATRASPTDASNAPRTADDARKRSTSSYGASGTTSGPRMISSARSSRRRVVSPIASINEDMCVTSEMSGTFRST